MDVIVFGAGGHSKVAIDILEQQNYTIAGIIDDDQSKLGSLFLGHPVIGTTDDVGKIGISNAFIAIGNNNVRVKKSHILEAKGISLINAIHPSAVISKYAEIGKNVFIGSGAIICAAAIIHDNVIINNSATIDHDCIIRNGVHISPGVNLAGNVIVGEMTHIGIAACVIPGINIGSNSIVGAGSVIIRDVKLGSTVVGVPGRMLYN